MTAVVRGLLLISAVLFVGPASASSEPPPPPVHVVRGVIAAHQDEPNTYVFSGVGFAADTSIRVGVNGVARSSATTSPQGTFSVTVNLKGQTPAAVTGLGKEPGGLWRVAVAAVGNGSPEEAGTDPKVLSDAPGRLYVNLASSLAVVLLSVMSVLFVRVVRRRP